jgi:regulator of cell morphogenesis and NO signaling
MEFENNLKIHLDLENDILFPKAILLDAELAQLN